jgi:hypothetical protein
MLDSVFPAISNLARLHAALAADAEGSSKLATSVRPARVARPSEATPRLHTAAACAASYHRMRTAAAHPSLAPVHCAPMCMHLVCASRTTPSQLPDVRTGNFTYLLIDPPPCCPGWHRGKKERAWTGQV